MDIITIDFETYYDRDYSLSKMTTEEYIRRPDFEIIGVGVKINDGPSDWYSGDDPARFLRSIDYSKHAILAHNTAFDGAILSWHMGIRPKLWLDTLSMARPKHRATVGGSLAKLVAHYEIGTKGTEVVAALGKRKRDFTPEQLSQYGRYCCNDVDMTYQLFRKLAKGFPASELALIDLTLRMYTEPQLVLDRDLLHQHLQDVRARKEKILLDAGRATGLGEDLATIQDTLMSNGKLAAALEALGVSPPMKPSPADPTKQTYAFSKTDADFTALAEDTDEAVAALVSARLGTKSTIEETRTERLLGVATRGTLPIMLNYYGAHTGRFSGGDKMNLQNLPRGGTLRRALRAPPGQVVLAADSSQIEARVVAWLAGQTDLLDAFRAKRDVYCEFASQIYGRKITSDDVVERFVGKTCILGLGYGMGGNKFKLALARGQGNTKVDLSADEAHEIVGLYRRTYHRIAAFWSRCTHALNAIVGGPPGFALSDALPSLVTVEGGIMLPNGVPLLYPMLHVGKDQHFAYVSEPRMVAKAVGGWISNEPASGLAYIYGAKTAENLTQAIARIVVTDQMLRIAQNPLCRVVLSVHDEVVSLANERVAGEAAAWMNECMSTPPAWATGLPVACKVAHGKSYGECK